MSILLIRHGETPSNAARIVQTPEVPLSARGCAQAASLARRLARHGVARILSSDLRRAEMTAEAIQATTGAPLSREPLLQERSFGEVRGTAYADLGGIDLFAHDYAPPGGETGAVFDARVDAAWLRVRKLAGRTAGNLAVVTHGLVCDSLARRHLRLPARATGSPIRWGNTALTLIDGDAPWSVRVLACLAHLEEEARETPTDLTGRA